MKKRKQKLLVRASALLLSLTTVTAIVLLCGCNNKKDGTETTDAATNATTNAETTAAETNEETTVSESTAAPATGKQEMTLDPVSGVTLPDDSSEFSWTLAHEMLVLSTGNTLEEAKNLFRKAGFKVVLSKNFDKANDDRSHTSAYTVGTKEVTYKGGKRTAVLVAIRGTHASEWYSNMDFDPDRTGDPAFADNFLRAAEDVYAGMKEATKDIENPIYLVTGYSRGAACANLTGYLINRDRGTQDSFIYAFACPTTVRKDPDVPCTNIFNMINPADSVTASPLVSLGFHRLGTDIVLPGDEKLIQTVNTLVAALEKLSPSITSYYNDKHSLTGAGLSEDGMTGYEASEMLAGIFASTTLPGSTDKPSFPLTNVSPESDFYPFVQILVGLALSGGSSDPTGGLISTQHYPQTYLALMNQKYLSE